jgi:REP element-mobilizing transposase RayT
MSPADRYGKPEHHRRSIRLDGYDYTCDGYYFVTLVTANRDPFLAQPVAGKMVLTQYGLVAQGEWENLAKRFDYVVLDAFVVMPDHVHAVIGLMTSVRTRVEDDCPTSISTRLSEVHPTDVRARQKEDYQADVCQTDVRARHEEDCQTGKVLSASPRQGSTSTPPQPHCPSGSLGVVVGAYKSSTARIINALRRTPGEKVWLRNYYEHIVCNEGELDRIRRYILANPERWKH